MQGRRRQRVGWAMLLAAAAGALAAPPAPARSTRIGHGTRPRSELAATFASLRSDAVLKFAGFPSLADMVGPDGVAALPAADRALAAQTPPGCGGGSCDATHRRLSSELPDGKPGEVVNGDSTTETSSGRTVKQTIAMRAEVDGCPNEFGKLPGEGEWSSDVRITVPEPDGTRRVYSIKMAAKAKLSAVVKRDASVNFDDVSAFDDYNVVTVDTDAWVESADGTRVGEGTQHHTDHRWGFDTVRGYGRLLHSDAPNELYDAEDHFLKTVVGSALRAYGRAQQVVRTPNKCVGVKLSPAAAPLRPGQKIPVRATPALKGGQQGTRKRYLKGDYRATPVAGARVRPPKGSNAGKFDFSVQAPAHKRSKPAGARVRLTSNQGVAEASFDSSSHPPSFGVTIQAQISYDWRHYDSTDFAPDTDSYCHTDNQGSGNEQIAIDGSPTGALYPIVIDLQGSGLRSSAYGPARATVTRTGTMTRNQHGAPDSRCQAHAGTFPEDASGCGTKEGQVEFHPVLAGDKELAVEFRWVPEEPAFGPCPLWEPLESDHPLAHHLSYTTTGPFTLSDLQDAGNDKLVVRGGGTFTGREACDDNGGQGCVDGSTYETTAGKRITWTVTFTRLG